MIKCPLCSSETLVSETRDVQHYVRRRRWCKNLDCQHRLTTIEMIVEGGRRQSDDAMLVRRRDLETIWATAGRALSVAPDPEPELDKDKDNHDDHTD